VLHAAIIIPAVPAASFVLILFFGKRIKGGNGAHFIGVPALAATWVLAVVTAVEWISRVEDATGGHEEEHALGRLFGWMGALLPFQEAGHHGVPVEPVVEKITWWQSGGIHFGVGTQVDGLTCILLFVVATVSLLVHIYSTEYVKADVRYTHYYAFLSLFTASMLFFVLTENIIQLIVGWELVGLCSFVLIGHWWEDGANTNAALKAFLTNRVGDIGLIVGVIIVYFAAVESGHNTFAIQEINSLAAEGELRHLLMLVASLCLLGAVSSKSGQFPLHTWLPDAMAGPTPVSALIHAATMVVAGVYMVARLYPVFYEGFSIGDGGVNAMAVMGAVTVIGGGLLAFVQDDIKKVLAYSTVSQLGYMVMALGVGAWGAAIFHLFTHAFFKACLFLGAGSVSHACHHSFDMKKDMGGLRRHMPQTFWTFVIASAALAGVFPLAGFWSKDEILNTGWESGFETFTIIGAVGALLTAAYMTRVVYLTFFGEYRGHAHPHESPKVMTVPLIILAGLAVAAGFFNAPPFGTEQIVDWVEPTTAFPETLVIPEFNYLLAFITSIPALLGIGVMYLWYWRGIGVQGITERNVLARGGYTVLRNKYYLDHLYTDVVVGSIKGPIARAAYWFNQNVIDRVVNEAGVRSKQTGRFVYRYVDQAVVDGTVKGAGAAAEESGQILRRVQTGKVQNYGSLLFGAAAVLAILFVIVV
jgi:NADH-quinone oxidoreductase subunit L